VVAQTQWIKKVIYIGTGLVVLWILAFLFDLVSVYRIGNYAYVPAWIGYLLFIIYIGYYGFEQTSVLTERKKLNHFANEERVTSSFTNETSEPSTLKYFQELEKYMMFDKMYLNPYLDLNSLADKLDISPNYLSKIVNSHDKVNFSDYVNTYRISYAKKMLAAIEFKEYNMLSIALESGFNSKSSFYAAFNKLLGQPPGYFRSHKQS
nr:helix-turn-helix domain-containing protein [Bacteroidota bacterium]